ncbi:MAG: hypothetical protein R6V75_05740, partial [Bacteroidales bacterium]
VEITDFIRESAMGKYLVVTSSRKGHPTLRQRFGLLPGKDFLVVDAGLINLTDSILQVNEVSVVTSGRLYGGRDLSRNFHLLDGNGGGEDTRVTAKPALDCRNNALMMWGKPGKRRVLVAGGLTYNEIEKFVRIGRPAGTTAQRQALLRGLKPVLSLDAGREELATEGDVSVKVLKGNAYRWDAGAGPEYDGILFDKDEVLFAITGLKKGASHALGVAWSDDAETRVQSVAWSLPELEAVTLLPAVRLPSHGAGEAPSEVWMNLPGNASGGDTLFIHIRNEGGINAVVARVMIASGSVSTDLDGKGRSVLSDAGKASKLQLDLYAKDPVGKRIDPGHHWFPEDAFYLAIGPANPFEALEQYGRMLKDFQQVDLEYYTFPTVCLWYAQHELYGDGPSVNDAPGAVEEMDRVVKSGFLNYSPVSIRLVPDAYEENNEQGWWDDEHWRMYGTGKYANPPDRNVDVSPGHYKPPYETTRKWAQAIRERGGIPLTYFQAGRRSDDYAEAFPEHMLFNRPDATIPDPDWMIKGKGGYDFTDPGFIAHMEEVYRNLAEGGVQGLMYDYPYTAWSPYGGMEDAWSTTAAAYRNVFQLARNGLGPDAFLDERNLDHGSDITLGIVSSQRIWGDTDRMSPQMLTRGALRWYKNRQVVSYDMDAKNLLKVQPSNRDGVRKMLTLMYATCGRFLMANSFDRLSPDLLHDLSRIFPYPDRWVSFRPVDAFVKKFPETFVAQISSDWWQVAVYNPDNEKNTEKNFPLSSPDYFGGLELDPGIQYYVYEFWDDRLLGIFSGADTVPLQFRAGEAKMLSLRVKADHPQLLSTDRHLMQGMEETRDWRWDQGRKELTGMVRLVEGEAMDLTFAGNGLVLVTAGAGEADAKTIPAADDRTVRVRLLCEQPGWKKLTLKWQ